MPSSSSYREMNIPDQNHLEGETPRIAWCTRMAPNLVFEEPISDPLSPELPLQQVVLPGQPRGWAELLRLLQR